MATTTPNFGWPVPTSTDLVKDGATAIEALGDGIDASLLDLKGGTTGQVLAKTSATDLDFTWVTTDDTNAIQNAIVDAKGDLIAASANDTPARLAVGNNGETLVADSSTSTGLRYQGNFAAGKNKIINGDFGIWQRGTTFTNPAIFAYFADRFSSVSNNTGGTVTLSRQAFTGTDIPVAGAQYYFRTVGTAPTGAVYNVFGQKIENVQTFAGQTVTVSFYAKADSVRSVTPQFEQNFGSGGSAAVATYGTGIALTTSWARYSQTFSIPSISGKTIGTSSFLQFEISQPVNVSHTIEYYGIQVEAGSVATAFQTATGTLQGELAACQRYYYRNAAGLANAIIGLGIASSTTLVRMQVAPKVTMRIAPTVIEYAGLYLTDGVSAFTTLSSIANSSAGANSLAASITVASGLTQFRSYELDTLNNTDYIAWSAEL